MTYTPIKDAKYKIRILKGIHHDKHYYWTASTPDNTGMHHIYSAFFSGGGFFKPGLAIEDFKEFARINCISNYIIDCPFPIN